MSLRAKVLSGLRWITVAKLSTQLISWASTIVVMRLLRPDDYGLIAMAVIKNNGKSKVNMINANVKSKIRRNPKS